jgi:hypothetical protein
VIINQGNTDPEGENKSMRWVAIAIIFSTSLAVATTAQEKSNSNKGKKIGASSVVVDGKKDSATPTKRKVIGASAVIVDAPPPVTTPEAVKALPPPPPNLSRLSIFTNAPLATVTVNKKSYRTNDKGVVPESLDLKPGATTITVEHPDFLSQTETLTLVKGKSLPYSIALVSRYGQIRLGGIPEDAQILLDEQAVTASRDGETILLTRITTGQHTLRISHPDYLTRQESLEVKPGEDTVDAKGLELALADLVVEALPGAEVYVDNELRGKVLPDGTLSITAIKPGERQLRVVKNGYIEQKLTTTLAVGSRKLAVNILPIPNSGEFFDPFNSGLSRWDAPAAWRVEGAKMIVQGPRQIGTPKGGVFRDFDGQFSVKLVNGKGVAWTIHLQGNNYYLFYLSGPQGRFPRQLRSYIVQNNQLDLEKCHNAVSTDIVRLTNNDIYTIRLRVRGNRIETFIKPETGSDAGTENPLDVFIDEANLWTYGNVGFVALDGEEVLVDDVGIKPLEATR